MLQFTDVYGASHFTSTVNVSPAGTWDLFRLSFFTNSNQYDSRPFVMHHLGGYPGSAFGLPLNYAVSSVYAGSLGNPGSTDSPDLFNLPEYLAIDPTNSDIYVADTGNHAIRKITAANTVTTIVGGLGSGDTDGAVASAQISSPKGICVSTTGDIFFVDSGNSKIKKISGGVVSTITTTPGTPGHGLKLNFDETILYRSNANTQFGAFNISTGNFLGNAGAPYSQYFTIARTGVIFNTIYTGERVYLASQAGNAFSYQDIYFAPGFGAGSTPYSITPSVPTVTGIAAVTYYNVFMISGGNLYKVVTNKAELVLSSVGSGDLAFDPRTGHLYMADTANHVIRKFIP